MKDMPNLVRKPCAFFLSMVLLLGCAGAAFAEPADAAADTAASQAEENKLINRYPLYQSDYVEEDIPYYYNYLNEGVEKGYQNATSEVGIDLAAGLVEGTTPVTVTDGAIEWNDEQIDTIQWSFSVPQTGFYNIEVEYTPLGAGVDNPSRTIKFDGEQTFRELLNVEFSRSWRDANKPWVNSLGDQVRPKQVQDNVSKRTTRVQDQLGRSNEPLKIYLTAGEHTMTWVYIQEKMSIHSIKLVAPETYSSYAEVKAEYDAKGYQPVEAGTEGIKIDAEYPVDKSDAALRIMSDTDPKTDPPVGTHTLFNAIGGDTWSGGGQTITWSFDVVKAGLYKIDLRVYSKYNDGLPSYRKVLLDGQVPFEELLCYEFDYSRKGWYSTSLQSEEGDPYLFYLEPGSHTLALEVVTSSYAQILLELDRTLAMLSDCIQKIIMITGIEPDVNFDYRLEERIPGLIDNLTSISESLNTQIELLSGGSGKSTSSISSLRDIKFRIDRMLDNNKMIARTLTQLIEDQTTLSNWINGFNNLPLMLDYMVVSAPEDDFEDYSSNFFQKTWFSIRNFLVSFTRDYDVIAGTGDASASSGSQPEEPESEPVMLRAWVSRGKEWAEILKQLSDEEFSANTNIYVDYNMLPAGQLGPTGIMLLAVASGTEPDLVIGSDQSVPTEYGMRDQVLDLTKFPDYNEVASQLLPGAITPYKFKGAVYALPETVDFSILYYRTDIMASLNLQVPDTWEQLYSLILPELKRNGMDFWYEGGYNTFLFQQGGTLYTDNDTKSGMGSAVAFDAFKQFCDLYTVYKVPVAANFYNRFRAGQMPIGINSFQLYLQLTSAAPELEGKWAATVLPATVRADGTKDRSSVVNTTSCMIFGSTEHPEEAWQYLKWYTSAETQIRYANDIVAYIGPEARWFSSNIEAFDTLSWDKTLKAAVQEQRESCVGIPNVIGGYITARHQENARVRSVVNNMNYRESLERAVDDINRELTVKNEEFELRAQKEAEKADKQAQ